MQPQCNQAKELQQESIQQIDSQQQAGWSNTAPATFIKAP